MCATIRLSNRKSAFAISHRMSEAGFRKEARFVYNRHSMKKKPQIAVIGSAGKSDYKTRGWATSAMESLAREIGKKLALRGAIVVTGGKDGIMEAAAQGAKEAGGITVGVVKGKRRGTSNRFTDIEIVSGMEADGLDELLIALMSDALIVIGGGAGTLQEITLGYRNMKPIVALAESGGWAKKVAGTYLDERKRIRIQIAKNSNDAVRKALQSIGR